MKISVAERYTYSTRLENIAMRPALLKARNVDKHHVGLSNGPIKRHCSDEPVGLTLAAR